MRILSLIVVVAILILSIAFASLNASSTTVSYLFGETQMPLIAIMFVSLISGVVLCFILMSWKVLKLKAKIHVLQNRVKKLEQSNQKTEMALKEI